MDLYSRFWDSSKDVVATRYYSSEFLGKSSANDLCSHFEQCLGPLEKEKLLQVSSDRPTVNLLFLKALTEKCKDEELNQLIGLGTCDLHTTYYAFKHGEKLLIGNSKNDVIYEQNIPWGTWKAFTVTGATEKDYPMQFITNRWVEIDLVVKKAKVIWSSSILLATITQKQTAWDRKTWSQHQLWPFM